MIPVCANAPIVSTQALISRPLGNAVSSKRLEVVPKYAVIAPAMGARRSTVRVIKVAWGALPAVIVPIA